MRRPRARSQGVLLAGALLLAASAAADPPAPAGDAQPTPAPPRWAFGRTAAVFHSGSPLATQIAGFVDASFQDNDLPGEEFSLAFDHVNVSLDTRWRAWQVFVEGEYEHETDLSGFAEDTELELEQAYLKLALRDAVSLRAGRFNTPFGYWIPLHWSILMDTIEKPLHDGYHMVPEQQLGAEVAGRLFPGHLAQLDAELDYALFGGYAESGFDQDGATGATLGADLRLQLAARHSLGVSVYRQKNERFDDRVEKNLILYGELALPARVLLRTEYVRQWRDRQKDPALFDAVDVVYTQLRWYALEDVYLSYRFSYGDDDFGGPAARHLVHTFTVGWQPISPVRVKVEFSDHAFRDGSREDFRFWGFSLGYRF